MTSLIRSSANIFRVVGRPSCINGTPHCITGSQLRFAGHAKWQNIKGTKEANDLAKGKMISRYVMLVRRAVIAGGLVTDPKLNGKLGDILAEANKMNVPKATLERAIVRATNLKVHQLFLEVQASEGYTLIVRCETENVSGLRRDVKKAIKKFDASLLPDNTLMNMFKSKGFIRARHSTKDGRPVNEEFAEEAAIMANAEEVKLEEPVGLEEGASEGNKLWVFTTEAGQVDGCKGELEKLGLDVVSSEVELVAYREIKFPLEVVEKLQNLVKVLRELEQVVDVYHNVDVQHVDSPNDQVG